MYIVAIAWLYVTLLMALTETSITAAVLTFLFYGLLPCALLLWLLGTPQRWRDRIKAQRQSMQDTLHQPDGTNTKRDQDHLL